MQLPLTDPDTLFEELLQDLPSETVQMARECKAFVRAKKVKTPAQLLRVVFLYCGLDKPLRVGASDAPADAPYVRCGYPAYGAALCGHRREQYSSPRRQRHRSSPAYRDGL